MTVATLDEDVVTGTPARVRAFARRHRWSLGGLALSVVLTALVLLASLPTGAPSADRTAPTGTRIAGRAHTVDVEVLILSRGGALSAQVAYRGPKGWLSAPLDASPTNAIAVWTSTKGHGPIPALAIVYGRAPGRSVRVDWADGRSTTVRTASDGVYVIARDRYVASMAVHVLDAHGVVELTIEGP